ncbi:hypothetical protein C2W62_09175 [Candidatus Entotheonella serta]|nr:hypothetical protein C2W62_09175 [Candidatus Entotheonella serta]
MQEHLEIDEEDVLQERPSQPRPVAQTSQAEQTPETPVAPVTPEAPVAQASREQRSFEPASRAQSQAARLPGTRQHLTLPPKVAKFTQTEFNMLRDFCQEVDLSPRTAKRLINIYKILKILWYRMETNPAEAIQQSETIKKAVLAMLVLSGRYPTFMRYVFVDISTYYEQGEKNQDAKMISLCLRDQLHGLGVGHDIYLNREWENFTHDAQKLVPSDLTLNELQDRNFYLALSFCFVGDIGYDPADFSAKASSSNGASPLETLADQLPTTVSSDAS